MEMRIHPDAVKPLPSAATPERQVVWARRRQKAYNVAAIGSAAVLGLTGFGLVPAAAVSLLLATAGGCEGKRADRIEASFIN